MLTTNKGKDWPVFTFGHSSRPRQLILLDELISQGGVALRQRVQVGFRITSIDFPEPFLRPP